MTGKKAHISPEEVLKSVVGVLTLEEAGAYFILCFSYLRDGRRVRDKDAVVADWIGIPTRTWRRLKASLIAKGSISVRHGALTVDWALDEVLEMMWRASQATMKGRAGAMARWGGNGADEAAAEAAHAPQDS